MSDAAALSYAARAHELADWAWERWVNRTDAWGGYRDPDERGKVLCLPDCRTIKLGTSTTRPAPSKRGQVFLTKEVLARHFRGRRLSDLVGAHTTSPTSTSLWGGPEIDYHGPDSSSPRINLTAAVGWYEKLAGLGFHPLLTDSNGAGGYHLAVMFAAPVPTPLVHAFLQQLVGDHARYSLPAPPETFPKQPRVDATNRYGNWLRLPGRHHTRDHWSRVWDGCDWLEGHRAIDHMLSLQGDSPGLIPAGVKVPLPRRAPPRLTCSCPLSPGLADARLARRVRAYLATCPNLDEGFGRDRVAYRLAAWLIRDLALSEPEALAVLAGWDAGNRPPKGAGRLAEILANVRRYGKNPVGSGLAPLPQRRQFRAPSWRAEVAPAPVVLDF